jgi:protoporphyrinogen oxidase
MDQKEKQKVAVVGTGPAGLVAAWALQNDLKGRYDVTIMEMVSLPIIYAST